MVAAVAKPALAAFLLLGPMAAIARAEDLSRYRDFQFGMDMAAVVKLSGASPSQAKDIYRRPALIQELTWRPQTLGPSKAEPAQEMVFTFYNGELYQIVVSYDRYETEGMTAEDVIDAFSAIYGVATRPAASHNAEDGRYSQHQELLAQWQDPQYRYDLTPSSYREGFKLTAVLKRLEVPAQAAALEAKRLDDLEAPQRDAARLVSEEAAAKVKLDKARLLNKPRFRP